MVIHRTGEWEEEAAAAQLTFLADVVDGDGDLDDDATTIDRDSDDEYDLGRVRATARLPMAALARTADAANAMAYFFLGGRGAARVGCPKKIL